MGKIKAHLPVKLVCAVTVSDVSLWEKVRSELQKIFGELDHLLNWYDFHHTDYYRAEMGSNLKKRMLSFAKLISAERLVEIKLTTNGLEKKFLEKSRRKVNLDPGYISASKLVLATTKDYSHRLYLGKGIFGDLHLSFRHHHFSPNSWTYPDYREPFVIQFFEHVQETYMRQLG
ncbi:MAG: DUF4416 family protein, partial [Calditrichia bacterium]